MSIPSPSDDWRIFDVGQWLRDLGLTWFTLPFAIHAYALCILIGIVAAVIITGIRLKNRGADPGLVLDIAIWAVPLGIIGGRIFHVLTHPDDYFYPGADLLRTLYIWEGGLAIFGALILGGVGVFIGCRFSGLRFWTFADALAPGLLVAQAFGRFGNYFNQELFGLPTDLPWGLQIDATNPAFPAGLAPDTLFHPTFLYEIVWNLAGAALLILIDRAFRPQWGKMLGLYLIWYGTGRSVFESIRIDPSEILLGVRTNVWAALGAVVLGLLIIIIQRRRHPGLEPSPYLPGREPLSDAEVESDASLTDEDDSTVAVAAGIDGGDERAAATSGAGSTRVRSKP